MLDFDALYKSASILAEEEKKNTEEDTKKRINAAIELLRGFDERLEALISYSDQYTRSWSIGLYTRDPTCSFQGKRWNFPFYIVVREQKFVLMDSTSGTVFESENLEDFIKFCLQKLITIGRIKPFGGTNGS